MSRAVLFARILLCVQCSMRNVRLSTDHCFSMFQPATHKTVVLDTAWPWASEAYGLCRLCAFFCAHKLIRARSCGRIVLQIVASSMIQRQLWRWILLGLGPMTLTGFAVCAHTFVRINLYAQDHTRDSFPLQIRMSWARAFEGVSVLVLVLWSWVLVAERAFAGAAAGVVSWQSAPVLVSAGCARCGSAVSWLCVQAVYILVPASRMSTGRGMLPLSGSMLFYFEAWLIEFWHLQKTIRILIATIYIYIRPVCVHV